MARVTSIKHFDAALGVDEADAALLESIARRWILEDLDPQVRVLATKKCLSVLSEAEILEGIELERFPWYVTEQMALQLPMILERVSHQKQLEKLVTLFLQPEGRVRLAAVRSIEAFVSHTCRHPTQANWLQLYLDPEPKVRLSMVKTSPRLLDMLSGDESGFDNLRKAVFTVVTTDSNADVRSEAIVQMFERCIHHYELFDTKQMNELYQSIVAFKISWKPLRSGVKCISIALQAGHPPAAITKMWTAAISHHVAILRDEAIVALAAFKEHLGLQWLKDNIVPILEQTKESSKRHMVRSSCNKALEVIQDMVYAEACG